METSGGWPYIPRLQLRTFLDLLDREELDRQGFEPSDQDGGIPLEPEADDGK